MTEGLSNQKVHQTMKKLANFICIQQRLNKKSYHLIWFEFCTKNCVITIFWFSFTDVKKKTILSGNSGS